MYTDSNFAEKADDRRSVSGVLVCFGYSTICGFSSTQKTTSLSTAEAEYQALGDGVKEALFAKSVASFMVPSLLQKIFMVDVDNEGAINLATNPFSSARTKHIDVRFHFIRELVSSGTVAVEYWYGSSRIRSDNGTTGRQFDKGARWPYLQGTQGLPDELFSLIMFWIISTR